MKSQSIRQHSSRYGLVSTAFNLGYRGVNRAFTAMVLKVLVLSPDGVNRSLIKGQDDRWKFLSREEIERFSRSDPALGLDGEFLTQAFARGDRCYGVVQDGVLVSYGWYSRQPTPISEHLTVQFNPDYVYAYKAFTAPAFRGRQLHGIGMGRAMQAFLEQGRKGLILYVEAHNQASLKSCERIGCRNIGTVTVAGVGRACAACSSPGCRPFGFGVRVG